MLGIIGEKIIEKTHYKHSRRYLDKNLSFKCHISHVKKLNKCCGNIHNANFVSQKHLIFYKTFAESTLQCGLLVNGNAFKTASSSIDTVQPSILRITFLRNKYDSLFEKLNFS